MAVSNNWSLCALILVVLSATAVGMYHTGTRELAVETVPTKSVAATGASLATKNSDPTVVGNAPNADSAPLPVPLVDLVAAQKSVQEAETIILEAMQVPVTQRFEASPLHEVLYYLADVGKFDLWIDEEALKEEGVRLHWPITAKFNGAAVEQVLDIVLEPLGLTWLIDHETVQVTTIIAADELLVPRAYGVGKLRALNSVSRNTDIGQGVKSDGLMFCQFGGSIGGEFQGLGGPPFAADGSNELDWLVDVVREFTGGRWTEVEGTGGSVSLAGDFLVVRQTYRVHRHIAGLVAALERIADGDLNRGSLEVRPLTYPFAADAAIRDALLRKVSEHYFDVPLGSVLADFERKLGATIVIDHAALEEEGVSVEEPVSLHVADMTLHSALNLLLKPLALEFIVNRGVLQVTTDVAAGAEIFTVVYVVRDLEDAGISTELLPDIIENQTLGPWSNVEGTGGSVAVPIPGILFARNTHGPHSEIASLLDGLRARLTEVQKRDGSGPQVETPDPEQVVTRFYSMSGKDRAAELEKALATFIAPETWEANGGPGVIRRVETTLVVRQSIKVHDEVRKFLDNLEDAEIGPAAKPAVRSRGSGSGFF